MIVIFFSYYLDRLVTKPYLEKEKSTVRDARNIFRQTVFSSIPVIDEQGKYFGVLNLRNLFVENDTEVNDYNIIDKYVVYIPPIRENTDLDGLEINEDCNYDILPVVDTSSQFKGFIPKESIYKRSFQQHKKMSNYLCQLVNSLYNGVVAINTEGKIVAFNSAAERILGHRREEIVGKHISYIDPAMGLLETLETCKTSIGVKTEINGFTILTNRSPLMEGEKCIGAVGVFIDISDFERISRELDINKALAQELNAVIESSYDGLYIIDNTGRVVRVNSAWEKICGFPRDGIIGRKAEELIAEGLYDNSAALLTLKKKETSTVMLEITSGPQKGQKIIATGTPILNEQGELAQVVVNVRDISALENLKRQLEETRELSQRYAKELEEIRLQQYKMDDIVAKSAGMLKVIDLALRVSQVDSTVIITGESGVGKEVIAKKIHLLSKRKNNSLIKINCGAIPENLLESELFGYEGGAFTGAKRDGKPGMFELASGGTLFLDEIGDLPLNLQVKLLRVLQEKEIVRVGGVKPIKVDTRIIAATNKDLTLMVRRGTFREDLFYRLNVVNIQIPPLRNRTDDLPPLISTILKKLNTKYGKQKNLSESVVECLLQYNWPGNIRELENTLERLVVLVNDDKIQVHNLPDFMQSIDKQSSDVVTLNSIAPLKKAVEEMENQLLKKALKEYGTTRKVAKVLEVNQSTIVRKMKQYNIERDDVEEHQNDAYTHLLRI
ncbi:MAG: sigma 54-interacting transcriptional regulator [Bacillota bacterium]